MYKTSVLYRYFLSLLTTYARQTNPDLENVLLKIKELKGKVMFDYRITQSHILQGVCRIREIREIREKSGNSILPTKIREKSGKFAGISGKSGEGSGKTYYLFTTLIFHC